MSRNTATDKSESEHEQATLDEREYNNNDTSALSEGDTVEIEYESVYGETGNSQIMRATVDEIGGVAIELSAGDDKYRFEVDGHVACELKKYDSNDNPRRVGYPTRVYAIDPSPNTPPADRVDEPAAELGGTAKQLVTDGGTDGCPHGHEYCERGADVERPELCFDCWPEVAEYDEQAMIDEATGDDPEPESEEFVPFDEREYGHKATCAVTGCDNPPVSEDARASREGLCDEHTSTAELVTDGGVVEQQAGGTYMHPRVEDVDLGSVIDLPYGEGTFEIVDVERPSWGVPTFYAEQVDGEKSVEWKDYHLQRAFEAGAQLLGGAGQ